MKSFLAALVLVALASPALAQRPVEVVAEVGLTNQANSANGVLYTPNQTGMFRVTFYVECTNGDPQGQGIFAAWSWEDDGGENSDASPLVCIAGSTKPATFVFVLKDFKGYPISWSVVKQPGDQSVYEVYLSLERIGTKVQ